jgi:hypothetical protein
VKLKHVAFQQCNLDYGMEPTKPGGPRPNSSEGNAADRAFYACGTGGWRQSVCRHNRGRATRRKQGKLFPNFSARAAGTNSLGISFANVAKHANPAINGSLYVPDLADFLRGHTALRLGCD